MTGRRVVVGGLARGCQGKEDNALEKGEGSREEKKGPIWELLGFTSLPIIGWSWGLVLCFPIGELLLNDLVALVFGGSVALFQGLCLLAHFLNAEDPSLERIAICGLKINFPNL